jgi:hypothetical protein
MDMKTTRSLLLLFGTLLFAVNTYAQQPSTTPVQPAGAQTISGEVLKIEGATYVIRDGFGKEVHLRVDENSKIEGAPKVGDRVEAKVMEGGWASSISKH